MPPSGSIERPLQGIPTGFRRIMAMAGLVTLALLLMAGALTIPFVFESPSMWYKFGIDKTVLRMGKLLGLAAGLLILLQLPLAGRLKPLDRIFSMPGLLRQHRWHAWALVIMALLHPACVLFAEHMLLIPLEGRYWPEWVGVALLLLVLVQFAASRWRKAFGLAFHVWLPAHRTAGTIITALLVVHVLFVSESFADRGIPHTAVWTAAGLFLALWLWIRSGWLRAGRTGWAVSRVTPTGVDCTCVELTPAGKSAFPYSPGQFVIVSFRSQALRPEPHPFTLASTPSRPGTLQLIVRDCGDWTRHVRHLEPGDHTLIQGPFGRFSHLTTTPGRELILIAGGIGITPMLSMLRFMADRQDERPITLIWSNRSPAHVVQARELEALAAQLTGLRHIPIFTRITGSEAHTGRLDRMKLESLLDACRRDAAVFVCGPPAMMARTTAGLKRIGFPARGIHTETFGF